MVIMNRFVRWGYRDFPNYIAPYRGFYYIESTHGERVIAANALDWGNNQITYRASWNFNHSYHEILPIGDVNQWTDNNLVAKWLDSLIYYSFLHHSIAGVPSCWYLKGIFAADLAEENQSLPLGIEPYFPVNGDITWALVKHGSRVWPIQVANNQFVDGWNTFCAAHELTEGCKVILACERRWVFNTIILNQQDQEMQFHWSTATEIWPSVHPVPDYLRTSCLPSVIANEFALVRFGWSDLSMISLPMVLQQQLGDIIRLFNMDELIMKMSNRIWRIPIHDHRLNEQSLNQFADSLYLDIFDYLLISVSFGLVANVIVLDSEGDHERAYEWI